MIPDIIRLDGKPHELHDQPPLFDPAGRCLLCAYTEAAKEFGDWQSGHRSWQNLGTTPDIIARMDAAEVEKWGAACVAYARLIAIMRP